MEAIYNFLGLSSNYWMDVCMLIYATLSTIGIIAFQVIKIVLMIKGKWDDEFGMEESVFFPILAIIISPLLGYALGIILMAATPIAIIAVPCYFIDRKIKQKYE